MRVLLTLALLLLGNATTAAVYRCTGFNGEPLFSDAPCMADGSASAYSALSVSGPGRPVQATAGSVQSRPVARARSSRSRRTAKPERRCEDIARQLDGIQGRLRAGYRVREGERLKKRRRVLEQEHFRKCR